MGLISWVVPVCGGVHLPLVYVHASKCQTVFGVVVYQRSMLELEQRMGVASLPWVNVHSSICETYLV